MSLMHYDRRALRGHTGLVGVDEAGRGALAGPVYAAAVWLDASFYGDKRRAREGREINDSKQLTPEKRAELYTVIHSWKVAGVLRVAVASADISEIAAYNILGATRLAMERCLRALDPDSDKLPYSERNLPLFSDNSESTPGRTRPRLLIDGRPLRPFPWRHEGVIDGDAKCFAIAAASIAAKVERDRHMKELDGVCPGYGLARHKGYGTPEHWEALHRLGPTPNHRSLFLRKMQKQEAFCVEQADMGW